MNSAHEENPNSVIYKSMIDSTPVKRVVSIEYRLLVAGTAAFPAARESRNSSSDTGFHLMQCRFIVIDALTGYVYLVEKCKIPPSRIIVGGNSAGGNLAFALTRYLRDERILSLPAALVLVSPWADISMSHHVEGGSSSYTNVSCDYVRSESASSRVVADCFLVDWHHVRQPSSFLTDEGASIIS